MVFDCQPARCRLVGLNSMRGEYEQAIVWYQRMTELLPPDGAKPRVETVLTMEAAHAYTMTGHAAQAYAILGSLNRGNNVASARFRRGTGSQRRLQKRLVKET